VGSLACDLFPVKSHASWSHINFLLESGLGSDFNETTWILTGLRISEKRQAPVLQYDAGAPYNISPKATTV
jgi:hypothetical protein